MLSRLREKLALRQGVRLDAIRNAWQTRAVFFDPYPTTKVSRAWVNFARHGNPNHPGLPNWPAFTADKRQTMVFYNECVVKNDPEGAGRRMISEG